ncbi:hypothetical protein FKM82_012164 [Ascaphus truei]
MQGRIWIKSMRIEREGWIFGVKRDLYKSIDRFRTAEWILSGGFGRQILTGFYPSLVAEWASASVQAPAAAQASAEAWRCQDPVQ